MQDTLQERGYRLTPQRMMILAAISTGEGHISAEEIYSQVCLRYPSLNISTVYRTLELLKDLGLVTETDMGEGYFRYHWMDKSRHHHLICQKCGAVVNLDYSFLEFLRETLLAAYQFEANLDHLAIFGACAKCRASTG